MNPPSSARKQQADDARTSAEAGDLTPTHHVTDRGFIHMPGIAGRDGTVRIYESSSADVPRIWLEVANPAGRETIHLDLDAAELLAGQLAWLVENHYQRRTGEARRGQG